MYMIIILIAISFYRGSPNYPAGTALSKPYYVWCAESGKVHSKMLAKKSKLQARNLSQDPFIDKIRNSNSSLTALPVLFFVLSPDSADAATLAVAGEPPRVKPASDPDPPLQVGVGVGLSGLYDSELGGTPSMLCICPNVHFIVLIARLVDFRVGRIACILVSEKPGTRTTSVNVDQSIAYCALIGRRDSARSGAVQSGNAIHRGSPALDVDDNPGMSRHSDPNNRPSGLTSDLIVTDHDPVISMMMLGMRREND